MRTTLDLPDALVKRAKIEAVERGMTLRELVSVALARELTAPSAEPAARRLSFPLIPSKRPGSLTAAEVAREQEEEDLRRLGAPG